jgi:hypothetical protein
LALADWRDLCTTFRQGRCEMSQHSVSEEPIRVGVFSSVGAADHAVSKLLGAGFMQDQITVICSDETREQYFRQFEHQQPAGANTPAAAAIGSVVGAAVGGLTTVAAGVANDAAALVAAGGAGAWTGGILGGFLGAMMTRGKEKELANYYDQAVVEGKILVAAEDHGPNAESTLARASQIMVEAGAEPLPLREG